MKNLVVYYSRDGNCRFLAQTVAAEIGADIEELVDLKNRKGILNWLKAGFDARGGKSTQIAQTAKAPKDYDLIVLGSPIWASRHAPAVTAYLKNNDVSGKKVAAFFSMGGKKPQPTKWLKALMPNMEFAGEIFVSQPLDNKADAERQIVAWCKTLSA